MSNYSIVEYLGGSNESKCGYCKQTGNYNSHGFWAHTMNVDDYQNLIDRNWRRSGQYCYVPNNKNTCCPMYTIKCDAMNFKLSRSHKKILKKVNRFLRDGVKEKNRTNNQDIQSGISEEPTPSKKQTSLDVKELSLISKNKESEETIKARTSSEMSIDDGTSHSSEKTPSTKSDVAQNSLRPTKKKFIRLERKIAKLAAKGLTLADVKRRNKSKQKTLEDFLGEEPTNGKHKLQVKLVRSTEGATDSILELFQSYQKKVHNDPPEKNSRRSYERFLVNSPLQLRKDGNSPPEGFGSFHYQYYIDGELIAVGVIDILPSCVSSVYFYYNPDYSFLSLGTYASLREIALVRQLSKSCPQLKYYYLGFYIPTCPKMRYKSNVKPSYLLCPEVFTWHLLDENLSKEIDSVKYLKINKTEKDKDAASKDDLLYVMILADRSAIKYKDYKKVSSINWLKKLMKSKRKSVDDSEEVMEYASKVGKNLSQSMLLFRC
ncbi:arginyl-tRNA--protein transferase 1 isoform X2 [Chironomus tepperi]|uniref:arginyl-tRNA--protein transferase 1 isoform X2 n=1 Tax=Chironomus tepperi TaxID=113505 RepID=UPI00391F47DA